MVHPARRARGHRRAPAANRDVLQGRHHAPCPAGLGQPRHPLIDADDLVSWHKRQRASGAADWSIRARWMAVRGLLTYAARIGYISANPCEVLVRRERPKPGRPRRATSPRPRSTNLLGNSRADATTINAMLVFSGLRVSELLGLTWSRLDFKQHVIRIRSQMSRKGKRSAVKTEAGKRDVILMDELARLLETQARRGVLSRRRSRHRQRRRPHPRIYATSQGVRERCHKQPTSRSDAAHLPSHLREHPDRPRRERRVRRRPARTRQH